MVVTLLHGRLRCTVFVRSSNEKPWISSSGGTQQRCRPARSVAWWVVLGCDWLTQCSIVSGDGRSCRTMSASSFAATAASSLRSCFLERAPIPTTSEAVDALRLSLSVSWQRNEPAAFENTRKKIGRKNVLKQEMKRERKRNWSGRRAIQSEDVTSASQRETGLSSVWRFPRIPTKIVFTFSPYRLRWSLLFFFFVK